jgi:hypothetical protein
MDVHRQLQGGRAARAELEHHRRGGVDQERQDQRVVVLCVDQT